MNRRQKKLLWNLVLVAAVTTAFSMAMINVRHLVNKTEAVKTMNLLSRAILEYRQQYNCNPSESFVTSLRDKFAEARLGQLEYRAQWIGFDASPDAVLAYSARDYGVFIGKGYVSLRQDGRVEWTEKIAFEKILLEQQSEAEIKLLDQRKGY